MKSFAHYLSQSLTTEGAIRTAIFLDGPLQGQRVFWIGEAITWSQPKFTDHWQSVWSHLLTAQPGQRLTLPDVAALKLDLDLSGSSLFVEQLESPPQLMILGGGHVSLPLSQIGKLLGFQVTVVDDRPEFATRERFTQANQVICADFAAAFDQIPALKSAYYVLVTRGHAADAVCATQILRRPFHYLGMIGSRGKVALTRDKLREQGFTDQELDRMHAPIGFKLGGERPAEIAVSIAAELTQVRNQVRVTELSTALQQHLADMAAPTILVTIIGKAGSSPRGAGSRMLVGSKGLICETIGGGAVEQAAIEQARNMLDREERFSIQDYDLSHAESATLGMICGGAVQVIFERLD